MDRNIRFLSYCFYLIFKQPYLSKLNVQVLEQRNHWAHLWKTLVKNTPFLELVVVSSAVTSENLVVVVWFGCLCVCYKGIQVFGSQRLALGVFFFIILYLFSETGSLKSSGIYLFHFTVVTSFMWCRRIWMWVLVLGQQVLYHLPTPVWFLYTKSHFIAQAGFEPVFASASKLLGF